MVSTRLTRRSMAVENVHERPGTSQNPQAEIVRLNERVAQLERELQEQNRAEQPKTQEDPPQGDQANPECEDERSEEVVEGNDESDGDAELVDLMGKNKKVKKEWARKLTKLE